MFKLGNIFGSIKKTDEESRGTNSSDGNLVKATKNWYEERTERIIVQRNILLILFCLLVVLIVVAIIAITYIVNAREFSPFVIQIDDSTGAATIVNPVSSNVLDSNETLTRYFIKKYLIARETYNPVDFTTGARKTIRLFSTDSVYWSYLGYINNKENNPVLKYAQNNTTFLTIKSWSKLDNKTYMVRFSVTETEDGKNVYSKIAVISYAFVPMELSDSDLDVNPVGFQINGYRVDDDHS